MSPEDFDLALRETCERLARCGSGAWHLRVADLRRALGDRVSHAEFDEHLRRLRAAGGVELTPHAHPALIGPGTRLDSLVEDGQTFYFLRCLR
jgi:hypothetical protein